MISLVSFIPLALWLVGMLIGFVCILLAVISMKKARAAGRHGREPGLQPPVLAGPGPGARGSGRGWKLLSRMLLGLGLALLAAGAIGIWSTGVSVGYDSNPATEWSDGGATALEPLLRKHCAPFLTRGEAVGLAVAVVTPTNATVMTFGHPSLHPGTQTGADTLFEIGSITKTFTALCLEREIEQGVVRLDQPIQELLPPGVTLPAPARGITLRHLTTHSSGLPRMPVGSLTLSALGMLLFGSDPYAGYHERDLLADMRSVKLQSPPGKKSCYTNLGMTLLGYLLATKAGCSYESLVRREVCLPLGLRDTTTAPDAAQAARVAQGYRALWRCRNWVVALRSAPWFLGNNLSAAGGLRSTAADMLKYLKANMHPEGQPLEQALRRSHQPLFQEDKHTSFGMNWILSDNSTLRQKVIWHNGGTGGFCSFLGFTADGRFGVLVLANSSGDADGLALTILQELAS